MMNSRSSGILMHISSLPSKYGIGDLGQEAYKFVDFLEKAKQKNWQLLPLGITGYGDSPYQSFSSYGGNPYFIDLDELIEKGYLTREEAEGSQLGDRPEKVDYGLLYKNKLDLLKKAYKNSIEDLESQLEEFYKQNRTWLREFSLFMSLKNKFNNKIWYHWPRGFRDHKSSQVSLYEEKEKTSIYFWVFTQYFFSRQWKKLKAYANSKGIRIIGDLPIYVSEDSADVWTNPAYFELNHDYEPLKIAGVPPDAFSESGQLWGNPTYRWQALEEEGYSWWLDRISFALDQVDILRIDHFRGFESYWEVDYAAKDAVKGQWQKGPGMKLIKRIREELGQVNIIVEDLGINTEKVDELVRKSGFPNMKVLQFAFNPWEESHHIPHRIQENSVVYTGTHDNPTSCDWFNSISREELSYVKEYLKLDQEEGYTWGLIRGAWASTANLALAPMQDFLGLGKEARMNRPGSSRDNWTWRIKKNELTDDLAEKIARLTNIYRR